MTTLIVRRQKVLAFTLVEVLVVIGIIVLVAALLFPLFSSSKDSVRRISCESQEKQLGLAVLQYVTDNDERFPSEGPTKSRVGDSWVSQCYPYFKSTAILRCPDDDTLNYTPGHGVPTYYADSYGLNSNVLGSVLGRKPPATSEALTAPARTALFFEVVHAAATVVPQRAPTADGSVVGNGGHDCGGLGGSKLSPTYPCGTAFDGGPGPLYVTGDIGGRHLNGGEGSSPRHMDGADYLACDGHVRWLRPERVSGGDTAVAEDCGQGTEPDQPANCRAQTAFQASGTGDARYALTFSVW